MEKRIVVTIGRQFGSGGLSGKNWLSNWVFLIMIKS